MAGETVQAAFVGSAPDSRDGAALRAAAEIWNANDALLWQIVQGIVAGIDPDRNSLKKIADLIAPLVTALAGLGTAATKNVGPLNGNVPIVGTGDKLPVSIIPSLMALGLTDSAGKLLASLMPALAITSVTSVASQAAMLALVAQEGDVAVRTDQGIAYILSSGDPTVLASWIPLPLPAGVVMMVAGLSGPNITGPALKTALAIAFADVSGLGSAATKNVGTAAGNVVALDTSSRLPAVDGSQLINLPGQTGGISPAFNFCAALAF